MSRNTILIADDAELNRVILRQLLCDEYTIIEAHDGIEAMKLIRETQPQLAAIILEITIPKTDGKEVLKYLQKLDCMGEIPVILVTGSDEKGLEEYGFRMGITDFIKKPFEPADTEKRLKNLIGVYRSRNELLEMHERQAAIIAEQSEKLRSRLEYAVALIGSVTGSRELVQNDEILRLMSVTGQLLDCVNGTDKAFIFPDEETICLAAALCNIGMLAVPDELQKKRGKLTDAEYEQIKLHAEKGAELLSACSALTDEHFAALCREVCLCHHERIDGSGYPRGLKGNAIPPAAQVVAAAEAFTALTSERAYRPPFTREEALAMLENGECGAFSPILIRALSACTDKPTDGGTKVL